MPMFMMGGLKVQFTFWDYTRRLWDVTEKLRLLSIEPIMTEMVFMTIFRHGTSLIHFEKCCLRFVNPALL